MRILIMDIVKRVVIGVNREVLYVPKLVAVPRKAEVYWMFTRI
jgi:hypothetical protein